MPDVFDVAHGARSLGSVDQDKLLDGNIRFETLNEEAALNCDPDNNYFDKICYNRIIDPDEDEANDFGHFL